MFKAKSKSRFLSLVISLKFDLKALSQYTDISCCGIFMVLLL